MRYHILTTDYDVTIAENEHFSGATLNDLVRLKGTVRYQDSKLLRHYLKIGKQTNDIHLVKKE